MVDLLDHLEELGEGEVSRAGVVPLGRHMGTFLNASLGEIM